MCPLRLPSTDAAKLNPNSNHSGPPPLACAQAHELYLSDFPTHDMAADFVLLAEQRQMENVLKEEYEVGLSGRGVA